MSDPTNADEVFYMVWNPQGDAPTRRHDSELSAVREAERLALANHARTFYVLEAKCSRRVEVPMIRTRLEHPIPF